MKIRFGARIHARRAELDLNQTELAEKAGVHRNFISSIEKKNSIVTYESLQKKERIALAYGLDWTMEQLAGVLVTRQEPPMSDSKND